MAARLASICALLLACNGGDRGEGPLSGSAGLSAGSEGEATGGGGSSSGDADGGSEAGSNADAGSAETTGSTTAASASASASTSDGEDSSTTGASTTGASDETGGESSESSGGLADGILDVTIIAHDDCTFTVNPASITVPEGTEFTVNWVSSAASEVEFDIAKIDAFNQVPIILGMEPGTSYHDDIREWCGDLFTGTFDFRLTSCYDDHYIPVDCGG